MSAIHSAYHAPARTPLWLRDEYKPREQRTVLTPSMAAELIATGHDIVVERSAKRIYTLDEYTAAGCRVANAGDWRHAPRNALILGLKELPGGLGPLVHEHVHFGHAYKYQAGWQSYLRAFEKGGGRLYDLEYLVDGHGRRVAAFGYWAGFAGAALALLAWAGQQRGGVPLNGPIKPLASRNEAMAWVRAELAKVGAASAASGQPRVLVIGALGRCGRGAIDLCRACGIEPTSWDLAETHGGGPFDAIVEHDVLINSVFVSAPIPPFTRLDHLAQPDRRLSVICDVSCDPHGPANPLPIYTECTDFDAPRARLIQAPRPLDLVAIDHLPSLLPRESSEDFCLQLRETWLAVEQREQGPWARAAALFEQRCREVAAPSEQPS